MAILKVIKISVSQIQHTNCSFCSASSDFCRFGLRINKSLSLLIRKPKIEIKVNSIKTFNYRNFFFVKPILSRLRNI